jgi:hypothetical protein
VKATAPPGLVPPRPNLGPEPWSEPQSMREPLFALSVFVLFLVVSAVLYAIWRRRKIARAPAEKPPPIEEAGATPRDQLIGLSGSLREALVDRFGPPYRARTIEELFADQKLGEVLGAEQLEQLTHFLVQVDRLKFAPERAPRDQEALQLELADWAPRVENLKTVICAKPAVIGNQKANRRRRAQRV